jgi:alpha-L-rhamnosidase
MEKWIAFMDTLANEKDQFIGGILWGDHTADVHSNFEFLAMAYYCLCCDYMIKVCKALNKDSEKYLSSTQRVRNSIVRLYKTEKGFCKNTQCEIALALALGIIEQSKGIQILEKDLLNTGYLMTCGGLGIYHLITELEKAGRNDLIYAICKCDKEGSYLSWIKNHGATTSFEELQFYQANSRNHPFLMGSVTTWFYQGLAGIKKTSIGYKTFDVKPYIPSQMKDLSVCVDTCYGEIEFSYKRTNKTISYNLTVPFGTTANLYLPNDKVVKLGSGNYQFQIEE